MANESSQTGALNRWNEDIETLLLQEVDDPRALWIIVGGIDLFLNPKHDGPFYLTPKPSTVAQVEDTANDPTSAKSEDNLDISDLDEHDPSKENSGKGKRKRPSKENSVDRLDSEADDSSSKKPKSSSDEAEEARKNLDKKSTDYSHYLKEVLINVAVDTDEVEAFAPPPKSGDADDGVVDITNDTLEEACVPLQLVEDNPNITISKNLCCESYNVDGSDSSSRLNDPSQISLDKVSYYFLTCGPAQYYLLYVIYL